MLSFVFTFIISMCFICLFCSSVTAIFYTPSSPSGPLDGFVDVDYEYYMNTNEDDSSWKFDWGDGTYSNWIWINDDSNTVFDTHRWSEPGDYEVRIKFRNKYWDESSWSLPITVKITPQIDTDNDGLFDHEDDYIDGDGVTNDNDFFPNDGNEWLDTDLDGIGDTADTDDDGDNLIDTVENQLGSNPIDRSDVKSLVIKENIHFLVDTDNDGKYNKFYNTGSSKSTSLRFKDSDTYLIDTDGDGVAEYSYDGTLSNYNPPFSIPLSYLVAIIIIAVIIVVFILFRMGVFYIYEEEYEIEE